MQSKKILIAILIIASIVRLYGLGKVPVSLFSDELDVGYQAYSVIKTGKDYFGNTLPLHFHSYVEYRAPLYIYSAVPTVAIFGITPYGIRLPAAIFGILGVFMMYMLTKELSNSEELALFSSFILSLNPWSIDYSRAAFEATELVFLILCGIYFFIRSLKKTKLIWLSALFLALTPWTYSTAKLFIPFLILFLVSLYRKELSKFPSKELKKAFIILSISATLLLYAILFKGAAQRFTSISVLGDKTIATDISLARLNDAHVTNTFSFQIPLKIASRVVNNKVILWISTITSNYLESFSTQFLFLKGDISPRQSVIGFGQFYKIDAIFLILGIIFFIKNKLDKKIKYLISFWILFGAFPSALTIEGGGHATRLILILPPLVFLISYGVFEALHFIKNKFYKKIFLLGYLGVLMSSFLFFQYNYWVRFPWYSEKSWHAGYKEAIQSANDLKNKYDKIVITNSEQQPYIFLAAYTNYDPSTWQKGFDEGFVPGFGDLKKIGKYYFGQVDGKLGINKLYQAMDENTLYVASSREVLDNLISQPQKTPQGLLLVKTISLPSGEPAFYIFSIIKKV